MATMKGKLVRLARAIVPASKNLAGPIGVLASLDLPVKMWGTIGGILRYKKEVKELEIEAQRIDREAAFRRHQIDAATRLALDELNQRSQQIQQLLANASAELVRTRIDRRKLMDAMVHLTAYISAPNTSAENQKFAQLALAELAKLQTEQMQHARIVFDGVTDATRTAPNHALNPRRVLAMTEE